MPSRTGVPPVFAARTVAGSARGTTARKPEVVAPAVELLQGGSATAARTGDSSQQLPMIQITLSQVHVR